MFCMKNNTKNKYFIVGASILMMCQPMTGASWRDSFSRENMTNIIWSKYGAIGGTLVALAIVGGVWAKWGKSIWQSAQGQPLYTQLSQNQITTIIEQGNTSQRVAALDQIYAKARWSKIPNFHTFIIKLWTGDNQAIDKTTLANNLSMGTYKDPLLCYILAKESTVIQELAKQYPILTQASQLLFGIVLQAKCKDHALPVASEEQSIAKYENAIINTGNIKELVGVLDILYAIQRWSGTNNFHTLILNKISKNNAPPSQPYITKDQLFALLTSKNEATHQALIQEQTLISSRGMEFVNELDRQVIIRILKRLIDLTKPDEKESKEEAAAAAAAELSEGEIDKIIGTGDAEKIITALDQIYAKALWSKIPNFHTFIIKLWTGDDQAIDKTKLQEGLATSNINPLLCYLLAKENIIIASLTKEFPVLKQAPSLLDKLAAQAQCNKHDLSTMNNPSTIAQYESDIIQKGDISQLVHLLDILYALQRWPHTENFHQILISDRESAKENREALIDALKVKNISIHEALILKEKDISQKAASLFADASDQTTITSILKRLIELTKPTEAIGERKIQVGMVVRDIKT